MPNLTIKLKLATLVVTTVGAFATFAFLTQKTLGEIKVTGPVYNEIITGKDLIADILPPPAYILESYLTTMKITSTVNPGERDELITKLFTLRKEFEDRQAYWKENLPAGAMRELLTVQAADPARQFFKAVDEKLLPLLAAGKREEATDLVLRGEVRAAYDKHRAAIDQLVERATAYAKETELAARGRLRAGWLMIAGTAVGSVTLLLGITAIIARSVTKPLNVLKTRFSDIARGEGDLTKRVTVTSKDELGEVAQSFNEFVEKIERVVSDVKSGAVQIDAGGAQIASASQNMAQGASEQASNLEEISASLEQISGQTQQAAENARQANALAQESKQTADRGQREMAEMNDAVNAIKQSSGEISKIIKVIDEIAFQTNLLALNAAVEAARAGEAGKGFAVVAEEVRNLAQRSAEAAKSTSAMIEESVRRSENGVQIAARVGQSLEQITASTNKVSALVQEIAAAAGEQATGIGQINQGVTQLDQVTQQNAGNSEELASSAEELSSQVASLNDLVEQFKVGDSLTTGTAKAKTSRTPVAAPKQAPRRAGKSAEKASQAAEKVIPMGNDDSLASF
jgi:methyl-accepting chemotaxis protein